MKKLIVFLIGFGIIPLVYSQEKDLMIISSTGSSYQSTDLTLDWSLGEVIIQTLEDPSVILSQGFHQPSYNLVSTKPIPEEIGSLIVYPNPFYEKISLKMSYSKSEKGIIELYDLNGKKIWEKPFQGTEVVEKYATGSLVPGSYLLTVILSDYSSSHAYQLLKTQ